MPGFESSTALNIFSTHKAVKYANISVLNISIAKFLILKIPYASWPTFPGEHYILDPR